jgi:hypothetical protein
VNGWSCSAHRTWATYGIAIMIAAVGCDIRNELRELVKAVAAEKACK